MTSRLEEALARCPIVPVVGGVTPDQAVSVAVALAAGGITTFELTLRDSQAMAALAAVLEADTGLVVGAGTVRTADQLYAVAHMGAAFAVSPGLTEALITAHSRARLHLLPGVATASEVMRATEAGFRTLKLFPAEAVGGLATLKALAAPFPEVRWMPTGGIRPDTAPAWLAQPNVVAVGGSWLTPPELIARGDVAALTALATEAVRLA